MHRFTRRGEVSQAAASRLASEQLEAGTKGQKNPMTSGTHPLTADGCAFCEVRDQSTDAALLMEDDHVVAFLDHRPLFHGHVLLIPRNHYETIFELPPEEVGPLFAATQRMSFAVREAMGSDGTFVASNNGVSQSVPHLHVHVVPRNKKDGLRGFMWPRTRYVGFEELNDVAERIRKAL